MPVPSSTVSLDHTRRSWGALLSCQVEMQKAMFAAALSRFHRAASAAEDASPPSFGHLPPAKSISKAGSCCIRLTCNAPPGSCSLQVPQQAPATLRMSLHAAIEARLTLVRPASMVRAVGVGLLPTEQLTVEVWGGTGVCGELHVVRAICSQEPKWCPGGHAPVAEAARAFVHPCIWPEQRVPLHNNLGAILTTRRGRHCALASNFS